MNTIHHLAFTCRNRAEQEAFYAKYFGFRRARVFNAGQPKEFILLRLGHTCIELFSADANVEASAGPQPVGFKHLAFEVPDLDAILKHLHDNGIITDEIIDCSGIVPGMRVCFFNDPEGNRLELMQGYHDQFGE